MGTGFFNIITPFYINIRDLFFLLFITPIPLLNSLSWACSDLQRLHVMRAGNEYTFGIIVGTWKWLHISGNRWELEMVIHFWKWLKAGNDWKPIQPSRRRQAMKANPTKGIQFSSLLSLYPLAPGPGGRPRPQGIGNTGPRVRPRPREYRPRVRSRPRAKGPVPAQGILAKGPVPAQGQGIGPGPDGRREV